MEIIKDADGSVAVPEVRSESRGGKDGPVAGEHVHVMVRDGRGREGPCLSVLSQRRSRRDAGDFMDSDSGHSRSGRERRIEVSHVEVGIERGGQGQRDSFPTADEAQMVVEDGDPHRPADAVVAHKRTRLNRSSGGIPMRSNTLGRIRCRRPSERVRRRTSRPPPGPSGSRLPRV